MTVQSKSSEMEVWALFQNTQAITQHHLPLDLPSFFFPVVHVLVILAHDLDYFWFSNILAFLKNLFSPSCLVVHWSKCQVHNTLYMKGSKFQFLKSLAANARVSTLKIKMTRLWSGLHLHVVKDDLDGFPLKFTYIKHLKFTLTLWRMPWTLNEALPLT